MQTSFFKRLLQTTLKSHRLSSKPQSYSSAFKFLASGLGATGLGSTFYHYIDVKNFSNKNKFTEMDQDQNQVFRDLVKGTVYGALCGDSIGSFLEFEEYVSEAQAKKALTMPGGGPFDLGSGQVTDDGELALCLGHGLVEGKGKFDAELIAQQYQKWIKSQPFDVGMTIGTAFQNGLSQSTGLAKAYRKSSLQSAKSQSNGALMRISPLCIWTAKLNKEDLKRCVREDTRLTHPNQAAIDVSIAYVYAIQHLLNNKGDSEGAYKKAFEMIKELGNTEVEGWLKELEDGKLPPANQMIGWVKIAFLNSLHFLKQRKGYADAMIEMLQGAGDTDTNCCIVGAMLGALHGFDAIPKHMTEAVRSFDPVKHGGIRRPDFLLAAKNVDNIIDGILANLPKETTEVLNGETEEEKAENKKGWFW